MQQINVKDRDNQRTVIQMVLDITDAQTDHDLVEYWTANDHSLKVKDIN